jgi:hypothetical protein
MTISQMARRHVYFVAKVVVSIAATGTCVLGFYFLQHCLGYVTDNEKLAAQFFVVLIAMMSFVFTVSSVRC